MAWQRAKARTAYAPHPVKGMNMNWQLIFSVAFVATVAIAMIAFAGREIGEVKAGAAAAARKAAATAAEATAQKWAVKYRNLEVLRDLQALFGSTPVTIFGSSQKGGGFTAPERPSDLDLMVEVDDETWAEWAAQVYPADLVGAEAPPVYNDNWGGGETALVRGRTITVLPYETVYPTRIARREAAQEILGIEIEPLGLNLDIFLFPHSFVREEMTIPAWDGAETGRSFREEVLAGVKLSELQPAD